MLNALAIGGEKDDLIKPRFEVRTVHTFGPLWRVPSEFSMLGRENLNVVSEFLTQTVLAYLHVRGWCG